MADIIKANNHELIELGPITRRIVSKALSRMIAKHTNGVAKINLDGNVMIMVDGDQTKVAIDHIEALVDTKMLEELL